jgi:hypothetical protein
MMFTTRELTEEEQAINDAIDAHREARQDERNTLRLAVVLYFVGLFMQGLSDKDTRPHNIGTALLICAILVFGVHLLLGFRTIKYKFKAKELMDPYLRKKALPFYQELTEKFADEPGIHLHLEEDGKILVTDRRQRVQ